MSRGVRYWLVSASKSCNVLPCVGVAMCIGASELSGSIAIIGIPRADTHCLAHSPNAAGMSLHFIQKDNVEAQFITLSCYIYKQKGTGYLFHLLRSFVALRMTDRYTNIVKYISLSYYRV